MAPPPLPSSPPAALPEELIEQILLRVPPEEPESLFRASLVCKRWRRLVSDPGFRRRFREFHRTPPTLGIFYSSDWASHFVPTTAFRPRHAERGHAIDARHGRVLLLWGPQALLVWDPITDQDWKVRHPPQCTGAFTWSATVLCSAAAAGAGGCDHLDCHRQPFMVVFGASFTTGLTFIYTYSSNAAAWSEPISGQRSGYFVTLRMRTALVGNTLYFADEFQSSTALKYNMQLRQMSWIQLPPPVLHRCLFALATTEDGRLQLGFEDKEKLYIWSTKDADEVDARWEQNRVIELNTMLPVDADFLLDVVGSMDDLSTIFVRLDDDAYAIDLRTCKVKVYEKVYEDDEATIDTTIIPYMSFYTPALEADGTSEGPSAGGSSA